MKRSEMQSVEPSESGGPLCLTVRQPWAWLIVHAGKDIENRSWPTRVRGRVLIHAAKSMTLGEYNDAWWWAKERCGVEPPHQDTLQRGGIIGSVEIVDCVSRSESPWFMGRYGFVLQNAQPSPFQPCRGALGFWKHNAELSDRHIRDVDSGLELLKANVQVES